MALSFDDWVTKCKEVGFLNTGDDETFQQYYYSFVYNSPLQFKEYFQQELRSNDFIYKQLLQTSNFDIMYKYSRSTNMQLEYLQNVQFKDFRCELKKYVNIDQSDFFLQDYVNSKESTESRVYRDITQHLMRLRPGYERTKEIERLCDFAIQSHSQTIPKLITNFFIIKFITFLDISIFNDYPELQMKVGTLTEIIKIYSGAVSVVIQFMNDLQSYKVITYGNLLFFIDHIEEFETPGNSWSSITFGFLEQAGLKNLAYLVVPTI